MGNLLSVKDRLAAMVQQCQRKKLSTRNNDGSRYYMFILDDIGEQEAQLPQRNSASAAHMEGGWG